MALRVLVAARDEAVSAVGRGPHLDGAVEDSQARLVESSREPSGSHERRWQQVAHEHIIARSIPPRTVYVFSGTVRRRRAPVSLRHMT
jgi:hypothetical protein